MPSLKKIKLILITDAGNEIDDQFAIYYALKSPEIDLLGVVSVQNNRRNGPDSVDIYHAETKIILNLCKSKIPCLRGSSRPLTSTRNPEKSSGVKFIIDQILESKEKIIIACTGPATDLANALLLKPVIAQKAVFVWLGGFINATEAKRFSQIEANYCGDKVGAQVFLDSDADKILIPAWGVADNLILSSHHLREHLLTLNLPITDYLAELLTSNWRRFWPARYLLPRAVSRYWIMFDLAAVAVAKNYGIVRSKKVNPNLLKIEKLNQHKILHQFEKYILS